METSQDREFMQKAIDKSLESIKKGGGPFGAVIVKDGKIIAEESNSVVPGHDPTAHAEVNAIRKACQVLGTHILKGCTIYTSCEPCPMCLSAIIWANIEKVYFCNSVEEASKIGFRDDFIYDFIQEPNNGVLKIEKLEVKKGSELYSLYKDSGIIY